MTADEYAPLTPEELVSEGVTPLPDKEVVSILDLAADVDLAIDGAAPIDLAVALNANVVAPIDAAVSANLLSDGSTSQALADQGVQVNQTIAADASATGIQDSTIDQSDTVEGGAAPTGDAGLLSAATTTGEPTGDAADAMTAAGAAPLDGSVVVGSDGNILGTLDGATGNVLGTDGSIIGTLNETTGVVVDSNGNLIGTVTGLVDGTTVLDSTGNVVGVLDGATGNVVDSAGNVVGALDPLTGQVLDASGNLVGTVGQVVDDVTDTVDQLDTGDLLKGDLLNVDVNVDLDADLAAPINGAVAANANVAAPIDAAVAANILSENSEATAIAQQDAIITQSITGTAEATSEQTSSIDQSSVEPVDTDTASADDPAAVAPAPGEVPATEPAATEDGTVAAGDTSPQ